MSMPTTSADGAPAQPGAGLNFIGGFGPSTPVSSDPEPAAEAAPEAPTEAAPVPAPAPEPEKPTKLAELIASQRADRQAKALAESQAKTIADENAQLKAQIAKLSSKDIVSDAVGWATANGLTKEEMALIGQSFLYDIVPDKAPPDWRIRQFEAKTTRESRLADERRAQEAAASERRQYEQQVTQYTESLKGFVTSADETAVPESVAWFGGNHDEYTQSLFATANNLAQAAAARGEVADLSPRAVAGVLEAEIKSRLSRRKSAAAGAPPAQMAPRAGGVQSAEPTSTQGLGGGGAPRAKAMTEAERLERAMAVAFKTK